MLKKKSNGIIPGAIALGVGSSVVEALPINPAKAGIQEGFSTGAKFISPMVSIKMGGSIIRSLKSLKGGKKR